MENDVVELARRHRCFTPAAQTQCSTGAAIRHARHRIQGDVVDDHDDVLIHDVRTMALGTAGSQLALLQNAFTVFCL